LRAAFFRHLYVMLRDGDVWRGATVEEAEQNRAKYYAQILGTES
jgi:hypothetical protein